MSLKVGLPDGTHLEMAEGATLSDVAAAIGPGLARVAVAGKINGRLADLSTPVADGDSVRLVTFSDPEGRDTFRHTSSHIMAQAVKRLMPEARLEDGPAIEDGFFYDIETPRALTPDDLARIETEMEKIVAADLPVRRRELSRDEAIALFRQRGEKFKVEFLQSLPDSEPISIYEQGEFVDLCRGPHLPSTGRVKAFKILSVAGAYRKGDQTREQLQRLYGTSFPDKKMLKEYLLFLEEAKKRDHRKLGRELDLFSFHDEGPGFPFFHANGTILYNELMAFCREELARRGYQEVMTPMILNEELWHRSGHWDHYRDNMYFTKIDERMFAIKPMNCPGGLLIYKTKLYSYRDLPLRVAEFGRVHRHELSGVLHGLFRVRVFTQDDAHHFCTPEQLPGEIERIIDMIQHFYRTFGFDEYEVFLSTRPTGSIGTDEQWALATNVLRGTLQKLGIPFAEDPGAGVFYGPKIDFKIRDCLKRLWQCSTIQVDFNFPERFDLTYVGVDGARHRPVMIHRAIFGSIERFLGVLIEHCEGNFPLWLAPVQVAVLPIGGRHLEYAREVVHHLQDSHIRARLDDGQQTIGHKIREAELQKIPVMLVIGDREVASRTVALRRRKLGDRGTPSLDALTADLLDEIRSRRPLPTQ
ncbi:MAG: threonine--tRNA ligase [Candidatus Sumerlaeia bacterium]|nr:threonine--tRNA ligase [Candidatus Sumerlaeia bacterium]